MLHRAGTGYKCSLVKFACVFVADGLNIRVRICNVNTLTYLFLFFTKSPHESWLGCALFMGYYRQKMTTEVDMAGFISGNACEVTHG